MRGCRASGIAGWCAFGGGVAVTLGLLGCAAPAKPAGEPPAVWTEATRPVTVRTIRFNVPDGASDVDLYLPSHDRPARLVVVAHGFARSRANMAEWGRRLAEEGYVAAVPDLPAWADHARNGRFVNQLCGSLRFLPPAGVRVEPVAPVTLIGFSAGGLATLCAAADDPYVGLWIGLDPVDRDGLGAAAARRLRARAVLLRAPASACNAHGNADGIERAIPGPVTSITVAGALHTDCEWPTDWKAELVCGPSSGERRAAFVRHVIQALRAAPGP